jgi:hypothetical protein|nr:MAG TPA: hypothetical protein [Caudoviricetes sp.]
MSEYKFKNLSEIDTVAEPAEGTTMMGFENGVPIQMPMSAVKSGGGVFLIDEDDPEYCDKNNDEGIMYGNKIRDALLSGKTVWVKDTNLRTTASADNKWTYRSIHYFDIHERSNGKMYIGLYYEGTNGTTSSISARMFCVTPVE